MDAMIRAQREQEVVKHNDMIQKSRFSLSLQEQKIVLFLISKIKPTDKAFHWYKFDIPDFCRVCGIDSDNGKNYKNLKDSIKSLADKSMWVKISGGSESLMRWINKAVIHPYDGVIEIRLDDDLMPYLLNLKENYTKYTLKYALAMESRYSVRLYELLRSLVYQGRKQVFELDELRRLLDAEEYVRFSNFNQRVLDQAKREINKYTDIKLDYTPIKEGRKTARIEFHLSQKDMGERLEAWETIDW